jgi:hypothetical protein
MVTAAVAATIATATTELCVRAAAATAAEPRARRAAATSAKPRPRRAHAGTNPRTRRATTHTRDTAATCAWRSDARLTCKRILGEACGRRYHWQNQRHSRSGTQNFKTDHCRLHTRDKSNPFERQTFPNPALIVRGMKLE